MDLILGMVSIVKDMNSVDKQYKNLNLQLKYTLDKANRLWSKLDHNDDKIAHIVMKTKMQEAERLTKKLDDLFNASSIAIKDKVRLSLPFNQTKPQIINVIETLEKVINDLKEQLADQCKTQSIMQLKQAGIKRKISESRMIQQIPVTKNSTNQLTVKQIDEQIQYMYEMGPTLKQDEYHISEGRLRQQNIQFTISIQGCQDIIKILQSEKMHESKILVKEKQAPKQQVLYTVARINFQKCYSKIKAICKDIDRISTKGHFHFVFKKVGEYRSNEINKVASNNKNSKPRISQHQKNQEEMFFSFPNDEKANSMYQFKLVAKKEDETKALYRISGEQWIKVEEPQVEILNGDRLAAFISPETKQPSIYFQLSYEINHF